MSEFERGMTVDRLETPCLLLDESTMRRNIARLKTRLASMRGGVDGGGAVLRPHLKTAKSIDVARLLMSSPEGPATVSTLKEAEYFAAHGVRDLLYAVSIAPSKLPHVAALRARGIDLTIIVDSVEAASAVAAADAASSTRIPVLIEIDSDGHRSGVQPHDVAQLLAIARTLHGDGPDSVSRDGGAELRGVMTHAGDSYNCRTVQAIEALAEQERAAAVRCATILRDAALPCPIVSVGSTPTAHFASSLEGVTEVRAGVFVFFDLVMAGLGVCTPEDIAICVLATVIGHQHAKGWIITDAGWMALSRDRGTSRFANSAADSMHPAAAWRRDFGYGIVCDMNGRPYPDLIVSDANQEHGILALRPGSLGEATLPDLPIGTMVRILPNHACATAAQHDRYHVLADASDGVAAGPAAVRAIWPRINGW